MSIENKQINWILSAADRASPVFRGLESTMGRLEAAHGKLMAVLGGAGAGGSFIAFWQQATKAQLEAEVATNRLNAVLTAAGGIAGYNLEKISDYADELAGLTQFDDESFRTAAGTLAKFGDIHGAVFREALKLTADYAAVVGSDVPSAAQALGKALQSPTEGLRTIEKEFGKLGVMQKENIKNMVESGRLAEAQALILDVLKGKIGGAAEAMNTGLNKATHDLTKSWNEMLEAFGRTEIVNVTTQGGLLSLSRILDGIKESVEFISSRVPGLGGDMRDRLPKAGLQGDIGPINMAGMPQIRLATEAEQKQSLDAAREAAKKAIEERRKYIAEMSRVDIEGRAKAIDALQESADDEARMTAGFEKKETEAKADRVREEIRLQAKMYTDGYENRVAWQEYIAKLGADADKADGYMKQLGFTMSSAFEDAISKGNDLRGVLQGLAQDIIRILARKFVSDPLGEFVTGALKKWWGGVGPAGGAAGAGDVSALMGSPFDGNLEGGLLGSFSAGTDSVPRTGPYQLHQGEKVVPAGQNGSGVVMNITYNPTGNGGAADAQAMAATLIPLMRSVARGEIITQLRPGGALV